MKINCYFTHKHLAYRSTYNDANKIKHTYAWQCHYCLSYYDRKDNFKRYLEHCSRIPGVVYIFDTQNLVTFEDNLKYKGN